MSNTNENNQQAGRKEDKKAEEPKDWMEYIQDFIKNPVTTGITGLAAGYLLGTYKASKDIEAIKAEHKQQMGERDEQFKLLIREIRSSNKMLASKQYKSLPSNDVDDDDDENTLEMEEDKQTKAYKYKPKAKKKIFEIT
ncbi:MAG: hypothetical protein Q8T03_05815 [Bacteroidota bacterium]|nr:hypothetical protein [Bacteroidota bacterium]MDP3556871.1 hypothetical protein [Bacteroidota bacterium]